MTTTLIVFFTFFLAMFTQSITGFGSALVSMGILASVLGLRVAAPLYAVTAIVLELILLIYFRHALNLKTVGQLILGSLLGIPIGIFTLGYFDETLMRSILGFVLVFYAIYGLVKFKLPRLNHNGWIYLIGFLSGILGGAYNAVGPPVIVYGHARDWAPDTFKANLQGYFMVGSLFITFGHFFTGNLTAEVWSRFGVALAATAFGIIFGLAVQKRIPAQRFQNIVLILLGVLGIGLIG